MERSLDGDRSSPVLQTRWEHSHDYDGPQQEPGRWPGRSDGSGLGKGERADPINVAHCGNVSNESDSTLCRFRRMTLWLCQADMAGSACVVAEAPGADVGQSRFVVPVAGDSNAFEEHTVLHE